MSTTRNRAKALAALTRYLEGKPWPVTKVREMAYQADVPGDLCPLTFYFQIPDEQEQFLFYIAPKIQFFEHLLPDAAEYVCRANYGLRIGNFELAYRTCQVNFKSSINFKDVELTEQWIDNVIQPSLKAFDEFFPGLAEVLAGVETPLNAIEKAEYGPQ